MTDFDYDDTNGWLELGGATTGLETFTNTTMDDVILRTTKFGSKLVLGNSNSVDAAMYITSNMIGIQKQPAKELDIHGDFLIDGLQTLTTNPNRNLPSSNIDHILSFDSSNILMNSIIIPNGNDTLSEKANNLVINSYGLIRNKIILPDTLKIPGEIFKNVKIDSVTENGVSMEDNILQGYTFLLRDEFQEYQDKLIKNVMFVINDTIFVINESFINVNTKLVLNCVMFLTEQNFISFPIPLNQETNADIQILRSIEPVDIEEEEDTESNFKTEYIKQRLVISETQYLEEFDDEENAYKKVKFLCFVENRNDNFFAKGFYYTLQLQFSDETVKLIYPSNILRLCEIEPIESLNDIENSDDNADNNENVKKDRVYLTFCSIDESTKINDYVDNIVSKIDSVAELPVVLIPTEIPLSVGLNKPTPIVFFIESTTVPSPNQIVFRIKLDNLESYDKHFLKYYKYYNNEFMYIESINNVTDGKIWSIQKLEIDSDQKEGILKLYSENVITDTEKEDLKKERIAIKTYPFRLAKLNRIGNELNNSYIPTGSKLGINTTNCGETLTVNGELSLKNTLIMYNNDSVDSFQLNYNSNQLHINIGKDKPDKFIYIKNNPNVDTENIHISATTLLTGDTYFSSLSNVYNNSIKIDGSNISAICNGSTNTTINTFGAIDTDIIQFDNLKAKITKLRDVKLKKVFEDEFQTYEQVYVFGVIISIDIVFYARIVPNDVIKINNVFFTVRRVDYNADDENVFFVSLEWYFPQEREMFKNKITTLPFKVDDKVDIHIHKDILEQEMVKQSLKLYVKDIRYEEDELGNRIYLMMSGQVTQGEVLFLSVGRFFNLSLVAPVSCKVNDTFVDHVLILKSLQQIGKEFFTFEFKSLDNVTDIKNETTVGDLLQQIEPGTFNSFLYIYPLESFLQPNRRQFPFDAYEYSGFPYKRYTEKVKISYISTDPSSTYLAIKDSELLDKFISKEVSFPISCTDRMVVENGVYDLSGIYRLENHIIAKVKFINTNLLQASDDISITFSFNGIPLHVFSALFPSDNAIIYKLKDVDIAIYDLLKFYEGHNAYIIDKFNQMWHISSIYRKVENNIDVTLLTVTDLSNNKRFLSEDHLDLSSDRHIFIVPVKFYSFKTNQTRDDNILNNYIPSRVGVNTQFIREMVTINGDLSCRSKMVLDDDTCLSPFFTTYSNDIFDLNKKIEISTSNVNFNADTEVYGTVTARAYLTNSDQRIKENIILSDSQKDLELINRLNIHNYNFIDKIGLHNNALQKGVLAQEVEKELPWIVSETDGVLPNINLKGKVLSNGKTVELNGHPTTKINPGDILKVTYTHSKTDVLVNVLHCLLPTDKTTQITFHEDMERFCNVLVIGAISKVKIVDHTYLFMTALNAIKALSREVKSLENKINQTIS